MVISGLARPALAPPADCSSLVNYSHFWTSFSHISSSTTGLSNQCWVKFVAKQKNWVSWKSLESSSIEDSRTVDSETSKQAYGVLANGFKSGADRICSVGISEIPQKTRPRKKRTTTTEIVNSIKNKGSRGQHIFPYPKEPSNASFYLHENVMDLSNAVAEYIVQLSKEAVQQHDTFTIVLSKDSTVEVLSKLAQKPLADCVDWEKWHVFCSDEVFAQPSHLDKFLQDEFLTKVKITKDQIHFIEEHGGAKAAAKAYEDKLRILVGKKLIPTEKFNKYPRFDLILLDLGLDGHIASLYPNSSLLVEGRRWFVPFSKSQNHGVTMTLPCINSAAHVAFGVFGLEKAEILERVLERAALPGALPAQMVRLSDGILSWFSDKEAASNLSIEQWNNPKRFSYFNFGPSQ